MRLLRAESMRFWARALVRWGMVGGFVFAGLVVAGAWSTSQPLPDEVLDNYRADYDAAVADWEVNGEEFIADCKEQEAAEGELTDMPADFDCDNLGPPSWENWAYFATFEREGQSTAYLALLVVPLVTVMIGTTFAAAEHSSGAIGNWLTFEPRRARVFWSKVAAAALGTLPLAVVMSGGIGLGSWWAYDYHGALGNFDDAALRQLAEACARTALLAVGTAALGVALGTLLRHTALVTGVLVGWAVLIEGVAAAAFGDIKLWTVSTAMRAWVEGGTTVGHNVCETDGPAGVMCTWVQTSVSQTYGGLVLGGVILTVLVLSWLVFRRRDVA